MSSKLNKTIIAIPAGYRYIGEWAGFDLNQFRGPYIIDKQIPGCGFTEYCLTNNDNIILCSPRKILLENKESQHPGEVYYVRNENEFELGVDKNLLKDSTDSKRKSIIHDILLNKEKIEEDLMSYCYSRSSQGKPCKAIVTYDSFKYVKDILDRHGVLEIFTIVIDEFQSIFTDSRFKPDTEIGFLSHLKGLTNNICFVSATPMLDEYLIQLDEFKSLPYVELDWGTLDPGRVMKPELKVRTIKSTISEIKRIIREYKNGEFAVLANPITGKPVQSKEAVFYVNSVNTILTVIKDMKLSPDEVNILCSDTEQNRSKIKTKFKEFLPAIYEIGKVPLKGEPHKMFTFCTRTVYLGADFYSDNARTFVLSDANIDSLSVDISLDLPQILGRQRLIENPWKNHAEFYFKPLGKSKSVTKLEFDQRIQEKLDSTERLLAIYNTADDSTKRDLLGKYESDVMLKNYRNDYISINTLGVSKYPIGNQLVYIAEKRAFDIQQIDYKDRFTVFSTIREQSDLELDNISRVINYLQDKSIVFSIRLKTLCESPFSNEEKSVIARQASESFDKFYNILGPLECRRLGYNITRMEDEVRNRVLLRNENLIRTAFMHEFKIGDRLTNSNAKQRIKDIYANIGITKSAKATDLEEYFAIKKTKILDSVLGKSVHGFEIIGIK